MEPTGRHSQRKPAGRNQIDFLGLRFPIADRASGAARRVENIQRGYARTIYRYQPRPYRGRVSLLVNKAAYQDDPTLGWADLISDGIEVHPARAGHETYIRAHVRAVADNQEDAWKKRNEEQGN